ncbi:MAG TPA: hypothetical protein VGU01_14780 [Sphingomicrobium sp.]|nr:hypothetical protein [Sphingomicrobium sp.]
MFLSMALTDEEKQAMRAATHEAAIAFLDDLKFMRRTLSSPQPTAGDVRRLSVVIRRFLLDGHLNAVAGPRMGRAHVVVPDFQCLAKYPQSEFISVGVPPLFGLNDQIFECYRIDELASMKDGNASLHFPSSLQRLREVNIQRLLSDSVVRVRNELISRLDFLKFVCYHDFGVHYSGREDSAFSSIRTVRYFLTFLKPDAEAVSISVSDAFSAKKPQNMLLDLAHVHTLSTGYYVAISPDLTRLETLIEAEVAGAESPTENSGH